MEITEDIEKKSDLELVEDSLKNPDSFAFIVARYQAPLFRYVKRISYFSDEDTEDILQEVFIRIYKNLNNFDKSLKFSSWAYRITHNYVIDVIRSKSRKPESFWEEADLMRLARSNVDLEKELLDKDCLEKVRKIIRRLPLKYRDALTLKFLEEKTYEEMMDILKKPKGSVATLINRGKTLLREELKKEKIVNSS
jgi:RNA polymerase sigma-70 factor, ECF subfamily